ncbi:anti sigma factor C-terminal domain-containing protein [Desulfosporosinus nitroreducens]|uniref:Anti-sigma factor n=1 Tax=Desulfosporosinus nitroreducens TaxID=2018668 RepID=A0ABT8QT12_9FIRM|nr:anti sigma factor C-terminal domain-containing protein [Desulfosporosinus nitroreducens]MDO0824498.1 anti-sigma factor [Desulfosporosinus nitroreducens]
MDDRELDELFDDDKLNMAIKKCKKKSTRKTILISLLVAVAVFIVIFIANAVIILHLSNQTFSDNQSWISLTVPNGYISKSSDSMGFLVGRGDYSVTRNIGNKPVVLENRVSLFGLIPPLFISRSGGGAGHTGGEWPTHYWENGYRKMIFFHPEITYKEYKNDLYELDQVSGDKLIELALSFDKPYKVDEIPTILPDVKKSWYWLDAFRKDDLDRYKKETVEYDAKATFLSEYEVLGVSMRGFYQYGLRDYDSLLWLLKSSKDKRYNEVYNELVTKGYDDSANVPILGAIVYGTKDELKSLIGNPHIKASSFGVVVDKY